MKKAGAKLTLLRQWRRRRDSNPRYPFGVYTISNRARSTSYATSPCNCPWATGQGCNPKAGQLRPACLVYTTHCKKSRAFFPFFWLTIFCMSLRGAKRWDNPFSCGSAKQNATIPGEYVRRYEFALSIANLLSFPAGTRIATPRRYKLRILRPGFSEGKARSQSLRCIAFSGPHRCGPVPFCTGSQ